MHKKVASVEIAVNSPVVEEIYYNIITHSLGVSLIAYTKPL